MANDLRDLMDEEESIRRALGPLHQVMDESRVNWDFDMSAQHGGKEDAQSLLDILMAVIGINSDTATVKNARPATGAHELMHAEPVPALSASGDEHPFIYAQQLFDARTPEEYRDEYLYAMGADMEDQAVKHLDDIPGLEYDMGARLQFDPDRGHNVEEVIASSIDELLNGGKENYLKYRIPQSYIAGM